MCVRVSEEVMVTVRDAEELAALSETFGTDSIHDIYFRAKRVWREGMRTRQVSDPSPSGLPGRCVEIGGHAFHVHGVTHSGTETEGSFLREHVRPMLDRGAVLYCEQGIRSMYFQDISGVCEMDDYLWARAQADRLESDTRDSAFQDLRFDDILDDIHSLLTEFREATFELIDTGSAMYGEGFERALGDIAAGFLSDHADWAVGQSYEAFRLSAEASQNPAKLADLQQYYERTFLPQPLEREWLRLHDPALELFSHARNERMAEYTVYHNQECEEVHLIVGAAHLPGVVYYLEQFRDGREMPSDLVLY